MTTETFETYFAGLVDRTLRQGGFVGQTVTSNIRRAKNGHTADVVATFRGVSVSYRATIRDGRVVVRKV